MNNILPAQKQDILPKGSHHDKFISSTIQTLTVGFRVSRNQPWHLSPGVAGYDRRWGITPRPEENYSGKSE